MKDFEVKRNKDGSFALLNESEQWIDGEMVKDNGGRISVWATARSDEGRAFYVHIPIARAMLDMPEMIEMRLRQFAEAWERGHLSQEACA